MVKNGLNREELLVHFNAYESRIGDVDQSFSIGISPVIRL